MAITGSDRCCGTWSPRGHESSSNRAAVLRRFARLLFTRQDEVLDLVQLESGKVRSHAFEEACFLSLTASYYARTAGSHLRSRRREGALPLLTSTVEVRQPKRSIDDRHEAILRVGGCTHGG